MSDEQERPPHVKTEAESSDSSQEPPGAKDDAGQKPRGRGTVSRPPSSHITRVDEEPTSDRGGGRRGGAGGGRSSSSSSSDRSRIVETVDRGTGPTPLPPPSSAAAEPRLPPYFPHYLDPRNGLFEPLYADTRAGVHSLSPHLSLAPYPINPGLPLNSGTLEGRYHWPPAVPFHQPMHGLSSPAQSDVSALSMRSPLLPGEPVTHLASRIHWEQLHRNFLTSPLSARRFSPASLPGLPLGGVGPLIPDYPPHPLGQRSIFSDVPSTPGSGSITLPGSLDSSRITSPRPSITGGTTKGSRKRALSHSPISDYLDIQSLTRSSEGSLQLPPFLHTNSRSSSGASGSYGHLSAGSLGAPSPAHPMVPPNPFFRSGTPYLYPPGLPPMMGRQPPGHTVLPPTSQPLMPPTKFEPQPQISTTAAAVKDASSSVVSSTMDPSAESKKSKIKKENDNSNNGHEDCLEDDDDFLNEDRIGRDGHIPQEGEPDFIETHCHWQDCSREFDTQDELVKHINHDHIQANKKSFVCRWRECGREEKPFKAQYMLVVHMRRHTGEKPHRCTFEGCNKAYSRLENLKTHLRSHTGEKPYMCEFPGCTKAFSNASDRAKHQNRTHSNAKPYVCKAQGCTKRYTDPSSLRKHVKTVHGPEFYAHKKHKGEGTGCSTKREPEDQDKDKREDSQARRMEECLTVTGLQPGGAGGERRRSQDTSGSVPRSHPSPQSSPEVNVTHAPQPELDGGGGGHLPPGHVSSSVGPAVSIEEEIDIPEAEEAEMHGSESLLARRNQLNANRVLPGRLKGRLNSKTQSLLPQIPSISPTGGRQGNTGPSLTDLSNKVNQMKGSPQHKRISDLINPMQQPPGTMLYGGGMGHRRDSNTSTLSSCLSSMRSDASPFPLHSQLSSRRSSGASQISARLSITNSPYEYDISGNLPMHSRRSSESSNIGNVAAQLSKAHLGSHPNLVVQSQAMTLRSPSTKYSSEHLARYLAHRREVDGARTSTPSSRTPLPHEIPGREVRRASDPVRTVDPNFSSLKRLQRFHSLHMMKPLPTPASMKSLQAKMGSNHTFHSSRSSLNTEISLAEDLEFTNMELDTEAALEERLVEERMLEERMLEDNEDMIIPDDMRRFLNECYSSVQGGGDHPGGTDTRDPSPGGRPPGPPQGSYPPSSSQSQSQPLPPQPPPPSATVGSIPPQHPPHPPGMLSPQYPQQGMPQPVGPGGYGGVMPRAGMTSTQQFGPAPVPGMQPGWGQGQPQGPMEGQGFGHQDMGGGMGGMPAAMQGMQGGMGPVPMGGGPVSPMGPPMQHMSGGPMQGGPGGLMPGPGPEGMMVPGGPGQQEAMMQWQQQQQQEQQQQQLMMSSSLMPPPQQPPYHTVPHPPSQQQAPQQAMLNKMRMGQMMGQKQERQSPQVQVPHISQSQIPPNAKTATRNQMIMRQQQLLQMQQQQQQMMMNGMTPFSQMQPMPQAYQQKMFMQGVNAANAGMHPQGGGAYPPPPQQQQQPQQPPQPPQPQQTHIPHPPSYPSPVGGGLGGGRPSCQVSHGSYNSLEASPGCNQVSSTTDCVQTEAPPIEDFMENLHSISTENLIDNISISSENMNGGGSAYSQTAMSTRSASQNSSRYNPALNTSNMVVNDMSSLLTQLAEENKMLNMRH